MEKIIKELAELVGGEVSGNVNTVVKGAAPLESASESEITFIASPKHAAMLDKTRAGAVIVPPNLKVEGKNLILSANPQLAFAKILTIFTSKPRKTKGVDNRAFIGRHPKIGSDVTVCPFAYVGDNVEIGDRTIIHPGAYIGDGCRLGEDVTVYPNATIMDGCIIGSRVTIYPGAVIGKDGFGFARDGKTQFRIPQVGTVRIDDDVEIGANTTVDRASFGQTWIKRGTKIDNLVQVAHNVEIGEDSIIVSQVGIAGSSKVGNNVILAGQVGVADHVSIGSNVMIGARGGVSSDIPDNQVMSGQPAIPHREWLKASVTFPKLPEMNKEIKELKKKIEELETILKARSEQ